MTQVVPDSGMPYVLSNVGVENEEENQIMRHEGEDVGKGEGGPPKAKKELGITQVVPDSGMPYELSNVGVENEGENQIMRHEGEAVGKGEGGPPTPKKKLDHSFELGLFHLQKLESPYFFIYGSALGVHRDNGPIDGDDDIDIAVPYEYVKKLHQDFHSGKEPDKCAHAGFYRKPPGGSLLSFWGYTLSEDSEYVCFGCEAACPSTTECEWRDAYPKMMLLPTVSVTTNIRGLTAQMPNNATGFLTLNYGDWTVPAPRYKGEERYNERHARYDAHC